MINIKNLPLIRWVSMPTFSGTKPKGVIIDPACSNRSEEAVLSRFVEEQGLQVVQLLNTHGHF